MKAKSELVRYLSSHTFCATNSEQSSSGLQLVGCSGISVKAMSRLMYTRQMMQHSGLNYAQSYSALMNSRIFSMVGVSRSSAILWLSNASGFSRMYFSSEKKNKSLFFSMVLPWL